MKRYYKLNIGEDGIRYIIKDEQPAYKVFSFIQNTPMDVWTIFHSANSDDLLVEVFDLFGNIINPSSISIVDDNQFFITFAEPTSGKAKIVAII